jgi:hypothetical protein
VTYLTGYSEGSFRRNDETFTSGGQCEDGLKMIFVIGEATVPTVDDSGGNPHVTAGSPPPNSEGCELIATAPPIETLPRNNYLTVEILL